MSRNEHVVIPEGWLSRGHAYVHGESAQLAILGGIPGEEARVRVEWRAPHQVQARFLEVMGPASPDRVTPACDRYALCGGCPWMHLSPSGQDRARMTLLEDAFREERLAPRIEPVVHGATHDSLHAIELLAGYSDEGHARLGVLGRAGNRVITISQCLVITPTLRELMKAAAHHMISVDLHPWENGRGTLKSISAWQSTTTGELLVTIKAARRTTLLFPFAQKIAASLTEVAGIYLDIEDDELFPIYGKHELETQIAGLRLKLGPVDPLPTHPAMEGEVAKAVLQLLAPQREDAVIDVGAGVGVRTLLLARKAGWALGLEGDPELTRRGKENAALNGISAEFSPGDLVEVLQIWSGRLEGLRPLIALDLNRFSLPDDVRTALLELQPRRLALISINPRALAAEVARLRSAGFSLRTVVPFDSAPHTPFGVTVALLVSESNEGPTRRAPRRRVVR